MKTLAAVLLLLPALSLAGGIRPATISTRNISSSAPAHYFTVTVPNHSVGNSSTATRFVYPFADGARLVDVIVRQSGAGTVGTSWSFDVRNQSSTSLFTTAPVATQASGAHTVTDAKGEIALPSGWTRPVLKTDSTVNVAKGAYLDVFETESGSYSVHPIAQIVLVFEPNQ